MANSVIKYKPNILGSVYYVSETGSDTNPGTLAAPFKTIAKGLSVTPPGGAVYVRGGKYNLTHRWAKSGTSEQLRVHLLAYPGETPIIDGTTIPAPSHYDWLVRVDGDYMFISGFQIDNAQGAALWIYGNNNIVDNVVVNRAMQNGIFVGGDHTWVQSCKAIDCCWDNHNDGAWNGYWGSGITAARGRYGSPTVITSDVTFLECICIGTWGEGFSAYESTGVRFIRCIARDNYSANYYIADASYAEIDACFSSHDPLATEMWSHRGSKVGYMFGCEEHAPATAHIKLTNSISYNDWRAFYWWYGKLAPSMNDYLVANNTFYEAHDIGGGYANVSMGATYNNVDHVNARFINNLTVQTTGLIEYCYHPGGILFDHNAWSKTPVHLGTNSVVGDPLLSKTATPFMSEFYKLTDKSPVIGKGASIPEVVTDYYGTARATNDIGAVQYATPIVITEPPEPDTPPVVTPDVLAVISGLRDELQAQKSDFQAQVDLLTSDITNLANATDVNSESIAQLASRLLSLETWRKS